MKPSSSPPAISVASKWKRINVRYHERNPSQCDFILAPVQWRIMTNDWIFRQMSKHKIRVKQEQSGDWRNFQSFFKITVKVNCLEMGGMANPNPRLGYIHPGHYKAQCSAAVVRKVFKLNVRHRINIWPEKLAAKSLPNRMLLIFLLAPPVHWTFWILMWFLSLFTLFEQLIKGRSTKQDQRIGLCCFTGGWWSNLEPTRCGTVDYYYKDSRTEYEEEYIATSLPQPV